MVACSDRQKNAISLNTSTTEAEYMTLATTSVASSTTEEEYMVLATTSWQGVWCLNACTLCGYTIPITIMADNILTINVAKNAIIHSVIKHIDVAYHVTREHLDGKCFTLLMYNPTLIHTTA